MPGFPRRFGRQRGMAVGERRFAIPLSYRTSVEIYRSQQMKVTLKPSAGRSAVRVVPVFSEGGGKKNSSGLEPAVAAVVKKACSSGIFSAKKGEVLPQVAPASSAEKTLFLLGLGPRKKLDGEVLRMAFGNLGRRLAGLAGKRAALSLEQGAATLCLKKLGGAGAVRSIVEGCRLGAYDYQSQKGGRKPRKPVSTLVLESGASVVKELRAGLKLADACVEGVNLARELANTPGNYLYPASLAARARSVARSSGLRCKVLGESELRRQKMGGILGVAQGSDRAPRLIELEYNPRGKAEKTLVIVGKAVTFDSGGISIKPAGGMQDMKFDMAGGAAAIGAMKALARLKPKLRVVGIVPSAENLLGGSAYRPGDVLRSASGKTIEIINTDAEGRLLLADALHYSRRFSPDAVVDMATLTGACVIALGTHASGLMSNDKSLARELLKVSASCGERIWELPLFDEYYKMVESKVADVRNSSGRDAGSSTAGAFLGHFIKGVPWAHLDIAGTAWRQTPLGYNPRGATGTGVRLMVELALSMGA